MGGAGRGGGEPRQGSGGSREWWTRLRGGATGEGHAHPEAAEGAEQGEAGGGPSVWAGVGVA